MVRLALESLGTASVSALARPKAPAAPGVWRLVAALCEAGQWPEANWPTVLQAWHLRTFEKGKPYYTSLLLNLNLPDPGARKQQELKLAAFYQAVATSSKWLLNVHEDSTFPVSDAFVDDASRLHVEGVKDLTCKGTSGAERNTFVTCRLSWLGPSI